jgi:myogenesis-regulating glycosidase
LVTDRNGNVETQWWNSGTKEAAYIDFTNPAAAEWFVAKLRKLQVNEGIDSFKFDAGEISWSPTDPIYYSKTLDFPHRIVKDYVRTCAKLGNLVEVRSAQGTQDLPIFLRMIDKDTEWTVNNGLPSLITTMLQMNMVGYPFVLPDMIGGNGYNDITPDREIFIRWLQANTFMPSIQFSFVPWIYDEEVT